MALPTSGQLAISQISDEFAEGSRTNVSLRALADAAGLSVPDGFNEFYGLSAVTWMYLDPQQATSNNAYGWSYIQGKGTVSDPLIVEANGQGGDGWADDGTYLYNQLYLELDKDALAAQYTGATGYTKWQVVTGGYDDYGWFEINGANALLDQTTNRFYISGSNIIIESGESCATMKADTYYSRPVTATGNTQNNSGEFTLSSYHNSPSYSNSSYCGGAYRLKIWLDFIP